MFESCSRPISGIRILAIARWLRRRHAARFRRAQMEWKRMNCDASMMSGRSREGCVLCAQRACGRVVACASLRRPVTAFAIAGQRWDQAKTRKITGEITGQVTGENVLFRSVKRLNRLEFFRTKKISKYAAGSPPKRKTRAGRAGIGNSARRKSPAPEAQEIELFGYFGAKKFAKSGMSSMRRGRR